MGAPMIDWSDYPNFSKSEFSCSHTGKCGMDPAFLESLQKLRNKVGKPLIVNSGYRHPTHPIEAKKNKPGEHAEGKAADIRAYGDLAYKILRFAPECGFTRIGVAQKGAYNSRYIHLGTSEDLPNPTIWSY